MAESKERGGIVKRYTIRKMCGYTVLLQPDGYIHHAIDSNGVPRYPYQISVDTGEWVNACGVFTVPQIRRKLRDKTAIWG